MTKYIPKVSKTLSLPMDILQRAADISSSSGKDLSRVISDLLERGIKDYDLNGPGSLPRMSQK